jgi:anti-sigma factor RsiW
MRFTGDNRLVDLLFQAGLKKFSSETLVSPKKQPFALETWSQGGLRYFVIGDASAADIDGLAKLFKQAS